MIDMHDIAEGSKFFLAMMMAWAIIIFPIDVTILLAKKKRKKQC